MKDRKRNFNKWRWDGEEGHQGRGNPVIKGRKHEGGRNKVGGRRDLGSCPALETRKQQSDFPELQLYVAFSVWGR